MGDRAFVGLGGMDIAVFDLADAERPVHVGTTRLPRTATSTLAAGGGHVFASGGTNFNELYVIDASEPGSLRVVGRAEGVYPAFDMDIHDRQVIVGSKTTFAHGRDYPAIEVSGPLHIVDVAAPDDPMVSGADWVHWAPILGTARVGDHLYARIAQPPMTSDESVRTRVALVDVTYPGHPAMATLLEDPGDANDLAVREDIAFVGTSDGWFEMFDVTSAEMPVRTGRVKLASVPITVAVQDDGPVFAAYAEYDAENLGTITAVRGGRVGPADSDGRVACRAAGSADDDDRRGWPCVPQQVCLRQRVARARHHARGRRRHVAIRGSRRVVDFVPRESFDPGGGRTW